MSFEWPLVLVALVLVPLLVAAYVRHERRRTSDAARFTNPGLLPNLIDARPGWRKLQVKVHRDGAHVRARDGFFVQQVKLDATQIKAAEITSAEEALRPRCVTDDPVERGRTGRWRRSR